MRRDLLGCAALAAVTMSVYAAVLWFPFISYDDPFYVTENPHLSQGVTAQSLRWTLWNDYSDNWIPLTWMSHLIDLRFFGERPGPHHAVSALLHVANSVLLFIFLRRATAIAAPPTPTAPAAARDGVDWRAWIVAAVFALHPLRVESVAWVSERKDVLSGFFFLITLIAYVYYAQHPSARRYALVALAYAAALMAKPMVVTLPFVLLLLDYWPLARLSPRWRIVILEKLPLLALAIAVSVATLFVQYGVGAVKSTARYTLAYRLANAAVAYVRYVGKTVWPSGLSIFYPLPAAWPAWMVALSIAALIGVTFLAWRMRRTAPYGLVGWLWFTGMLVPVIGILQVGDQSMADRYTYLPGIGLIIAMVWGLNEAFRSLGRHQIAAGAWAGASVIVVLAVVTVRQFQHWRGGTISLFQHAVNVTKNNSLAHRHLGSALAENGDYAGAMTHLEAALGLSPTSSQTHFNYGNLLARQLRFRAAAEAYRTATTLDPRFAAAHNSLGAALAADGRPADAEVAFRAAIDAEPAHAEAHANLGRLLALQGRHADAIEHYREALRLRSRFPLAAQGLRESVKAVENPGGGR